MHFPIPGFLRLGCIGFCFCILNLSDISAQTIDFDLLALLPPIPKNYIVYNKTLCTTDVTAYCTDGTYNSTTLVSNGYLSGTCPTGEYLCYVVMEFPSSTTILTANAVFPCPNPGISIDPDPCYQQHADWKNVNGYITCNIY